MSRFNAPLALLFSSLLLVRCASSTAGVNDTGGGTGNPDATTTPDSGTGPAPDSGVEAPDGGTAPDSGEPTPDSGVTTPDGGVSPDGGGTGNPAIGRITSSQSARCTGSLAGTCTSLGVHCDGVSDQNVTVKVSPPTGASRGTVLFGTGGPGSGAYEAFASGGLDALNMVRSAGFTVVQVMFNGAGFGWLTGPGGPRKESCRYATVAQWLYENVHASSETLPFCATGNSGGGTVIAYALAHYGQSAIFDFVLPTASPVMSRIDWGCNCAQGTVMTLCNRNAQPYCYQGDAQFLDGAYGSNVCSSAGASRNHQYDAMFLNDSVNAPDAVLSYPSTVVRVLIGDRDAASPTAQATYWYNSVTSQKSFACVPNTQHTVPDTAQGAMAIASDLVANCAVQ